MRVTAAARFATVVKANVPGDAVSSARWTALVCAVGPASASGMFFGFAVTDGHRNAITMTVMMAARATPILAVCASGVCGEWSVGWAVVTVNPFLKRMFVLYNTQTDIP